MASKQIDSKKQSIQMKTKDLRYGGKKYDELRNVSKLKDYNLIIYGRWYRLVRYGTWYEFRIEKLNLKMVLIQFLSAEIRSTDSVPRTVPASSLDRNPNH